MRRSACASFPSRPRASSGKAVSAGLGSSRASAPPRRRQRRRPGRRGPGPPARHVYAERGVSNRHVDVGNAGRGVHVEASGLHGA
eukprot:7965580-Pyramimonas_sp.AAC.1